MPIGVTGATGFLGRAIVEAALADGHEVVGIARRPEGDPRVRWRAADLADPDALRASFAGLDVVVANAALSPGWVRYAPATFEQVNVKGTENTLRAAAAAGVRRVVQISSVAVYRTRPWRRLAEDADRIDPDGWHLDWSRLTTSSSYSRTKTRAEQVARELADRLAIELVVLRPGPIVGPGDPKLTARLERWSAARIAIVPTLALPLVHVDDVAHAVVAALGCAPGGTYNLAGEPVPLTDVVRTLGPAKVVPVPVPVRIAYDCGAAARDLGFAPRSLVERWS